ncbi:MAG: class I SAM-dependent methyltransferase [Lentisphaerota bacterium]
MKSVFDSRASTWDEEPRRITLARDIFSAMEKAIPLDRNMEALDYGCGTGLITLALQPQVKSVLGVDSSRGMLEVLERKVAGLGIGNVRVQQMDLSEASHTGQTFDLITSSMTLHHVKNVDALLLQFHSLLRPGGYVALADLDTEDGAFHPDKTGVIHFGFDREALKARAEKAGFSQVQTVTAAMIQKEKSFTVFLLTARRDFPFTSRTSLV